MTTARDEPFLGEDPLKAVLSSYEVHVPSAVLGELMDIATGEDVLAAPADTVMSAAHWITAHDIADRVGEPRRYGFDEGETYCIALANEMDVDMFVRTNSTRSTTNSYRWQSPTGISCSQPRISCVYWHNTASSIPGTSTRYCRTTSKQNSGTGRTLVSCDGCILPGPSDPPPSDGFPRKRTALQPCRYYRYGYNCPQSPHESVQSPPLPGLGQSREVRQ